MPEVMVSGVTSIAGMRATTWMGIHQRLMEKSMERLATGKRVNRASDDPAAISVIDEFKSRRISIEKQLQALDRQEHYYGAREGLASVVADKLVELRGVMVAAANRDAMSPEELEALQIEADSILEGIDFLANTFNYDGAQIGQVYSTSALGIAGLRTSGEWSLSEGDVEAGAEKVEWAIESLVSSRGALGAALQSAEAQRSALQEELIQVTQAQSQIEDTDYAKETSEFVRAQALQQVAAFVKQMAAKQSGETVLALVKGVARVG